MTEREKIKEIILQHSGKVYENSNYGDIPAEKFCFIMLNDLAQAILSAGYIKKDQATFDEEKIREIICNTIRESNRLEKIKPCKDGFGYICPFKILCNRIFASSAKAIIKRTCFTS